MHENPLGTAPPHGVLGLNSTMVYGEDLQVAVGLSHQLALGSNLQLCVNPVGLMDLIPGLPLAGVLAEMLGSGIGGNMQLTIGTSATLVYGRVFDINLGPPKVEIRPGDASNVVSCLLCGALGVASVLWVILYSVQQGDHERANTAIVFQALIDAILVALMAVEMSKEQKDEIANGVLHRLFHSYDWVSGSIDTILLKWLASIGLGAVAIGAAVAPLVAIASDENS